MLYQQQRPLNVQSLNDTWFRAGSGLQAPVIRCRHETSARRETLHGTAPQRKIRAMI